MLTHAMCRWPYDDALQAPGFTIQLRRSWNAENVNTNWKMHLDSGSRTAMYTLVQVWYTEGDATPQRVRLLAYARSPRMRRASWMSLGMMVTRFA